MKHYIGATNIGQQELISLLLSKRSHHLLYRTMTGLNCYCDHCPNNTCTTKEGGLCYAEWAIRQSGNSNNHNNIYNQPLELERKFNCFNKDNTLFQSIVCNETVSNTSNVIRKCCNHENYCNNKENLLPSQERAYKLFETYWSPRRGNTFSESFWSLIEQYSNLPIEVKIVFIILSVLLLIFAIALVQNSFINKRWRRLGGLKRQLACLIGLSKRGSAGGADGISGPNTSYTSARHHGDEDCLENSSGKANSDVAVYDTNSMASREPLLNSCNMNHKANSKLNPIYQPNSLSHQHRGPYMTDETYNGKTPSTFQMTIGSATEQNKPETSSGSGAGQPYLTQRSIAHDIELIEVVGRGFFGVVWRGEYKGEPVAVKIFSPMAEPSWEREAEIYQTTMLRHKNILGFIATDKRHDAAMAGYWLVTDFYPMGSLYDFLRENSMSMPDAVRMAFSIANGLSHLHVEIFGTQGKPAIAHRDLKSKNILVKNDGTCCIADLGMAVRYNSNTGIVDVPTNTRVGTRRYLAPEILENRLNLMDFEAVKATDIYALGLVLWEILRRACLVHPSATNNVDPNFSYSMEQQQTIASTASSTSSPSSIASPRQSPSPKTSRADVSPQSMPPADQVGADNENSAGPSYQQPPNPPRTSTPHDVAQQSHPQQQHPYSTHTPRSQPQLQQTFHDSMETTLDDTNNDLAMLCDPYESPYQQHVSVDPTADEMYQVVCVQKIRPPISVRWTKFASMQDYVTLMSECWYEKPQSRLSALRIRKSLGDLARKYFNLNMEYD